MKRAGMNMKPSVWISAGSRGPGGAASVVRVVGSAVAVATEQSWQTAARPCVTRYRRGGTTCVLGLPFLQPR